MYKKLTIFTPVYNRAYCFDRLINSIKKQTCKDFEWIIVDDGSTDNIFEVYDKLVLDNDIDITILKQSNRGKYIAHNRAVEIAKGSLFVCVDSDDIVSDNFVETILKDSEEIINQENIIGIVYPKYLFDGRRSGNQFPEIHDEYFNTLNWKYNIKGETVLVYKTNLLKVNKFPEFENEKFCPEVVLYNSLDKMGKLLVRNTNIYQMEYQADGLSNNIVINHMKSLNASLYTYKSCYDNILGLELIQISKKRMRVCIDYVKICILCNSSIFKYKLNNVVCILLYIPEKLYIDLYYGKRIKQHE